MPGVHPTMMHWSLRICACFHPVLSDLCLSVCLSKFFLPFLPVCLSVDEGAEDELGPLQSSARHGPAATGTRHKFLTPSISVSVPDDEPYNSDEEYFEHLWFSSEQTDAGTPPGAAAQSAGALLGHDKGEQSMVPLSSSSPPPSRATFVLSFLSTATESQEVT